MEEELMHVAILAGGRGVRLRMDDVTAGAG